VLGEAATTEITKVENPIGLTENKKTAKRGGGVSGLARRKMEQETGKKIVSKNNYLSLTRRKQMR